MNPSTTSTPSHRSNTQPHIPILPRDFTRLHHSSHRIANLKAESVRVVDHSRNVIPILRLQTLGSERSYKLTLPVHGEAAVRLPSRGVHASSARDAVGLIEAAVGAEGEGSEEWCATVSARSKVCGNAVEVTRRGRGGCAGVRAIG